MTEVDGPAWVFLLVYGVVLPIVALYTARQLDAGMEFPPRLAVYAETSFWLLIMTLAARYVAGRLGISLVSFAAWRPGDWAAGLALLLVMLASIAPRWRWADDGEKARYAALVPGQPHHWPGWLLVSLLAGIGEETAYRGVLTALLIRLTGQPPLAVGLAALAFTLGHAYQGRTGMLYIFAIALGFHALVAWTGRLEVAIAVHVVFDVLAGLIYGRLCRPWLASAAAGP